MVRLDAGRQLRSRFAHSEGQSVCTDGMASSILEIRSATWPRLSTLQPAPTNDQPSRLVDQFLGSGQDIWLVPATRCATRRPTTASPRSPDWRPVPTERISVPAHEDFGRRDPTRAARGHLRALSTQKFSRDTAPEPVGKDPETGADLALDLAQHALARQLSTIDALDSKATSLAASALALASLFASFVSLHTQDRAATEVVLVILALVLAAAISLLTLLTIRPVAWQKGPKVDQIVERFKPPDVDQAGVTWRVIDSLRHGISKNAIGIAAKSWAATTCLVPLLTGTACVVGGLLAV